MYTLLPEAGYVLRVADNAIIPADPLNKDYADFLAWKEEGNTPSPYVPPAPSVPVSVTPLQARKALRAAGLKAQVDAFVATLSEEEQEEWQYANEVQRSNPIIAKAAEALGMTDEQVDDLFKLAATLA